MTKSGEPCLHSSPGKKHHKVKANIGPRRRMQQRTYPFVSVILSPGSKIGHTPRKNPSPSGAGNLPHQRISRLAQDACNYLHKPFAAKKDYNTASRKLQVFFGIFTKFFYGFSTFCRSLPVMHLLPCFWQKPGRIWCNTTSFCVQAGNLRVNQPRRSRLLYIIQAVRNRTERLRTFGKFVGNGLDRSVRFARQVDLPG